MAKNSQKKVLWAFAVIGGVVVVFALRQVTMLTSRVKRLETATSQRDKAPPRVLWEKRSKSRSASRFAPPDKSFHKVLRVVDGDTLVIATKHRPIKVRVIGIDSPETVSPTKPVEPFGPEASARAKQLLENKTVRIYYDPDPTHDRWGKYGRLLAYIKLPDKRDFGLILITEGLARSYPRYPFSRQRKYARAEKKAKRKKVGMWEKRSLFSPKF